MKKLTLCILAMILSLTFNPATLSAANDPIKTEHVSEQTEARNLIKRLEEIKAMDVKSMSHGERKAMRHEVKSINKKLHAIGGGIYISASALILILILLIIFL